MTYYIGIEADGYIHIQIGGNKFKVKNTSENYERLKELIEAEFFANIEKIEKKSLKN